MLSDRILINDYINVMKNVRVFNYSCTKTFEYLKCHVQLAKQISINLSCH